MKRYWVISLFILVLISIPSGSAIVHTGLGLPTKTNLYMPSAPYLSGSSYTISANAWMEDGSSLTNGQIRIHDFMTVEQYGNQSFFGNDVTLSNPTIVMTMTHSVSFNAIRIPMSSISFTNRFLTWRIIDATSGSIVATGDIEKEDALDQIAETNSLWLIIDSYQTIGHEKTSGNLTFSSLAYRIELNQDAYSVVFTMPTSGSGSVSLSNNDTSPYYGFGIEFLYGTSQTYPKTSSNGISHSWSPTTAGEHWIVSYYDSQNDVKFFYPSFNATAVDVIDSNGPTIQASDYSIPYSETGTLSATITQNGNPVSGASVNWLLYTNGFWMDLGTATSSPSGVASISHTASEPLGNYPIKIVARSGGKQSIAEVTLNVITPQAHFQSIMASGNYGSSSVGISSSIVTVTAQVVTDYSGNPVAGVTVNLVRTSDGYVMKTGSTNGSGWISFSYVHNGTVGTYPSFLTLTGTDPIYSIPSSQATVTINKGAAYITPNDISIDYASQPVPFTGTIVDSQNRGINRTILIEYDNGSGWKTISSGTSTNGNFNLPGYVFPVTQSILLRARAPTDALYAESIAYFTYSIGPTNATINRNNLNASVMPHVGTSTDPILVEYDSGANFGVFVQDQYGNYLPNVLVTFESIASDLTTFRVLHQGYSDSQGWVNFFWTPEKWNYDMSVVGAAYVLASAVHQNYSISSMRIYWKMVSTELFITTTNAPAQYMSNSSIEIRVTHGIDTPAEPLGNLFIEIEGANHSLTLQNGNVTFFHIFTTSGNITYRIIYVPSNFATEPYYQKVSVFYIVVQKGVLTASSKLYNAMKGEFLDFSTKVINQNGDAVNGLSAELWINYGGWTNLASLITNSTGEVSYTIQVPYSPGSYGYEWRIGGDPNYLPLTVQNTLVVSGILTEISSSVSSLSYYYSETKSLTVNLHDLFQVPINGMTLSLSVGNYSWTATTDSSGNVGITLPNLLPGSYILNVSFSGFGDYVSSTKSIPINVLTMPASLTWITAPTDTYYGQSMTVSLQLKDINGNPISGKSVDLQIGQSYYTVITDSSGIGSLTVTVKENNKQGGFITVSATFAENGYYSTSLSQNIKNNVRMLMADGSVIYLLNPQLQYATPNSLIVESWSNVTIEGSISVEIMYFNETIGSFVLLTSTYTNSSGIMVFPIPTSILTAHPVGSQLIFQVKISDPDFLDGVTNLSYQVSKGNVSSTAVIPNLYYKTSSLIEIHVTNSLGLDVPNLPISLTATDGVSSIGFGTKMTNSTGWVTFRVSVSFVGNVNISYSVLSSANYSTYAQYALVSVQKAPTSITATLTDINGSPAISGYLVNSNNEPIDGTVNLMQYINGQWATIDSLITTNGYVAFSILGNDTTGLYRLVAVGDSFILSSQVDVVARFFSVQITVNNTYGEINDLYDPQIILNSSDSFTVDIFVVIGTSELHIESLSIVNNSYLPSYVINLPEGNYSIIFRLQRVGWFLPTEMSTTLTVSKETPVITQSDLEIKQGVNQIITMVLLDNDGYSLDGITAILQIEYYGTWVTLANITSDAGLLHFSVYSQMVIGYYNARVLVIGNSEIKNATFALSARVTEPTYITSVIYTNATYSVGGIIYARLVNELGDPLANQTLMLYQQTFENIMLDSALTNSTGWATLYIPANFTPGQYALLLKYNGNGLIGASKDYYIQNYIVKKQNVWIEVIDHDYVSTGEGLNRTLIIKVRDETGFISSGTIEWRILLNDLLYDQGTIDLVNGSATLVIYPTAEMFGNYNLSLLYLGSQFYLASELPEPLSIGWTPVTPSVQLMENEFYYGSSLNLPFNISTDIPISDINVSISGDLGQYRLILNNGTVEIPLDVGTPNAGTYQITIKLEHILFKHVYTFDYSIKILPMDLPFSASIVSDYIDSPIKVLINDSIESKYNVTISDGTRVFSIVMTSSELATGLYPLQLGLSAGNFSVTIERISLNYSASPIFLNFSLQKIPVEITAELSQSIYNGTHANMTVTVFAYDARNYTFANLTIFAQLNSVSFVFTSGQTYNFIVPLDWNQSTLVLFVNSPLYTGNTNQTILLENMIIISSYSSTTSPLSSSLPTQSSINSSTLSTPIQMNAQDTHSLPVSAEVVGLSMVTGGALVLQLVKSKGVNLSTMKRLKMPKINKRKIRRIKRNIKRKFKRRP